MRVFTPDIVTKYPIGTVCAVWIDDELSMSTTPNGYVTAIQFESEQDVVDYGENVLNALENERGEIVHVDGDLVGQCVYCARWFIFAGAMDTYRASKEGGYACLRCHKAKELAHVTVNAYVHHWECPECTYDNYELHTPSEFVECERCNTHFIVS